MSARFFMLRVFCIIRRGEQCSPAKAFFPVKPRYHSENVRFLSAGAHIGAPLQCKGNVCHDLQRSAQRQGDFSTRFAWSK